MKKQEVRYEVRNEDLKIGGIRASRIATSFFTLVILSLGMFSSGTLISDVHAGALPCDPSTATCIDPDCDPTITSCPPVDPPGATKQSSACGPNAASACSPPGNPLGGGTDSNRLGDVANRVSNDDDTSDDDDEIESDASDDDTAGMPMMDEPILLSVHGETSRGDKVNRESSDDDDNAAQGLSQGGSASADHILRDYALSTGELSQGYGEEIDDVVSEESDTGDPGASEGVDDVKEKESDDGDRE
jgi:hypothetical protein